MPPLTPPLAPRGSSDIPLARQKLLALADELSRDPWGAKFAREIYLIVTDHMRRRYTAIPSAPPRQNSLTPAVAQAARAMKANNPELSQVEIGIRLGIGAGRVSEALAGHDVGPSTTHIPRKAP